MLFFSPRLSDPSPSSFFLPSPPVHHTLSVIFFTDPNAARRRRTRRYGTKERPEKNNGGNKAGKKNKGETWKLACPGMHKKTKVACIA
jgi:hypothetical protein